MTGPLHRVRQEFLDVPLQSAVKGKLNRLLHSSGGGIAGSIGDPGILRGISWSPGQLGNKQKKANKGTISQFSHVMSFSRR